MKKVTLKDIATELGVTIGTVSHVLNGVDDISEETREKVLSTARKLGYISNGAAVSLRSGKTNTIAIIIPDISNPHISHQVKLIEDKLKTFNYSVIILNTNENEKTEYKAIVTACSRQVDGIMLCPCQQSTSNVEFLNNLGIPYILIGRFFAELDTDYICADDIKSGYLAGRHLIQQGYKSPLYIGGYSHIQASENRFTGLCNAFEEKNIKISENQAVKISPQAENINDALSTIINRNPNFDSIVVFSDLMAFKVMSEIKSRYKEKYIPVIGFDGVSSHLFLPFHIISVGMVDGGWASRATSVLIKKINGATEKCKELIDVKIYE